MDPNSFFKDYYNKPDWWFKFRYDTQFKVKSAFYALSKIKFNCTGKNIFEFGFGSGELLLNFKNANGIYGVEISHIAIDKIKIKTVRRGIQKYNFEPAVREKIYSFQKSVFDLVIASHVIEHLADTGEFIDQVKYLLKDDGVVLIQIPINENFKDPKHLHNFTSHSLEQIFHGKGFKTIFIKENEFLFHIVEELYSRNEVKGWNLSDNIKRIIFNFTLARLPFSFLKGLENIYEKIYSIKPHQAVLIFQKNE